MRINLLPALTASIQSDLFVPRVEWMTQRLGVEPKLIVEPVRGIQHRCQRLKPDTYALYIGSEWTRVAAAPWWGPRTTLFREMASRDYNQAPITPVMLLAHVGLHLFVHLLNHISGKYRRGNPHNRAFYTLLDRAYDAAGQKPVIDALNDALKDHPDERLSMNTPYKTHQHPVTAEPGDQVRVELSGQPYTATVARIEDQRVSLVLNSPESVSGRRVTVPRWVIPLADNDPRGAMIV